jgi:hypothetical protein
MTEAIIHGLAIFGAGTIVVRHGLPPIVHTILWWKVCRSRRNRLDYAPFNWRVLFGPARYFGWLAKQDEARYGR